jgi:predicted kinase
MRKLIILRGLPGSGKSTLARELSITHFDSQLPPGERVVRGGEGFGIICSADDFMVDKDGKYQFNPKLLGGCHQACYDKVKEAMLNNRKLIIVDNTHSMKWEYRKYLEYANTNGYEVEVRTVGVVSAEIVSEYEARNIHNVPAQTIIKMIERWED